MCHTTLPIALNTCALDASHTSKYRKRKFFYFYGLFLSSLTSTRARIRPFSIIKDKNAHASLSLLSTVQVNKSISCWACKIFLRSCCASTASSANLNFLGKTYSRISISFAFCRPIGLSKDFSSFGILSLSLHTVSIEDILSLPVVES